MQLTPMRFKEYTWPHNPERYTVEYRRRTAALKMPFGGYVLQDLGEDCRVLRGEGSFAGAGAYEAFQALAEVFGQGGDGVLVHPVWPAARACFTVLEVTEEPVPDFVRYRFEFRETREGGGLTQVTLPEGDAGPGASGSGSAAGNAAVHTVRKGETLWGIARRYGVTLRALIAANPQIKNPNLIYPGDRVRLP